MAASSQRQVEEQIWIERAQAGDSAAFAQVVQAFQGPVYNLCYRTLGDREEAEDAAQETFLRAYNNFHRYDPNRRFLNWILSIASNHCIDRLRRRRHTFLSIDETPLPDTNTPLSQTPQQSAERKEQAEHIQGLLDQLDPSYRIPIVLLYWYELSYEEIAETMDISIPAVKSRLHRGRKQMAELISTANPTSLPTPTLSVPASV
ncbi:MAG: sigma-70 family RNA polymerase sigma factor [Caldilineales bacterium]|nr:sigma-70 family RNA polymerase sigma factor [Caldilineales bacterium]